MVASLKPRRPRCPKVVRFGSDFSGLDAGAVALRRMQIPHTVVFASDILKSSHKILQHVHQPKKLFTDILTRTADQEESVDVYVTTPPCQDVSSAGLQSGMNGPRRTGALISKSMKYVQAQKPRLVIFENVIGLTHKKFKPVLGGILKSFQSLGYTAHHNVLNSRDYGVPQDRRRVIIVAIRTDCIIANRPFKWPDARPAPGISAALDPWVSTDKVGRLPLAPRQKDACRRAYKECYERGCDARVTPILVDIGSSRKFWVYGVNEAKTITRARGGDGGPWISTRGRQTTTRELIKLQGFTNADVPWEDVGITRRQVGQLLGNAVTVDTIGCVLAEALWSSGLVTQRVDFPRGMSLQ